MTKLPVFGVRSAEPSWFLILFLVQLVATSNIILAQSSAASGRIEGDVVDVSGALVSTASITAHSRTTNTSAIEQSDSAGHFGFLSVTPGHYDVSVTKSGFQSVVI